MESTHLEVMLTTRARTSLPVDEEDEEERSSEVSSLSLHAACDPALPVIILKILFRALRVCRGINLRWLCE